MADHRQPSSLSPVDSLFLYFERAGQPVHVASVNVFAGVIPLAASRAYIQSKLLLIPRYMQRLVSPPYDLDLPEWEDDPNFDIRNHVHEVTLRRGTETEFKAVVARILSANVHRERPLWDITLVQGLEGNRTGVVLRIHHCLADGISGVKLLNVILDTSPTPPARIKAPPVPKSRSQEKSLIEEIIASSVGTFQRVIAAESDLLTLAKQVVAGAERQRDAESIPERERPQRTEGFDLDSIVPVVGKLKRLLPEFGMAHRLPFNVVCRGPQKFRWTEVPLADIKAVKDACGATVNDVVLTIVTTAVRRYAELHGVRAEGRALRIVVPVNIRSDADDAEFGNRITFLPVNVPMDIDDPRELLEAVREAVARSRNAQAAEVVSLIGTLVAAIPAPVQALLGPVVSQLPLSLCNLICTNVPGPPMPLYLLGHKMLACYPYVPIGGEMGMNCAVLTYNGTAFFGFTGDVHAIRDLEKMERLLDRSFAELCKAARVRPQRRPPARRKPPAATVSTKAAAPKPIPVSSPSPKQAMPAPAAETEGSKPAAKQESEPEKTMAATGAAD